MTLKELIVSTNLKGKVPLPSSIALLEIENAESFCRFAELNYLKSSNFKDDLIEILNRLVETPIPLKDFSLLFVKQSLGNLRLNITYKIEESL